MTAVQPRSALALALDATHARALLVERVDGHVRLVAVGEAPAVALGQLADAATAARAAVAQIEGATGRTLFAQGTLLRPRGADGAGVDAASLVVDAPLDVRVASCGDRPAAAAARRTVASLGFAEVDTIDLRASADPVEIARQLGSAPGASTCRTVADTLVLLGPADAPALSRLGQALALVAPTGAVTAPTVIWAGEAAGADVARNALAGRAELRIVDPIVPRADVENPAPLRDALLALWTDRLEVTLPGAEAIARWVDARPLPLRWAEGLALGHLAAHRRQNAWLARVGVDGALVRHASPIDPASVTSGTSREAAPVSRVRPWTLPTDSSAAREHATVALRSASQQMPAAARPAAGQGAALVVAAGQLGRVAAEDAFRALVDGLEPRGAVQVVVDELEGLAALGGLVEVAPQLAADVMTGDLLRPFGALVAPGWRVRSGRAAFRLRASADGKAHEPVEIGMNETRRVRLGEGEDAAVHVTRAAWWDIRRFFDRLETRLEGGPIGLVLDARSRPAAGPLSLGRDTIVDDAGPARSIADLVASRPIVAEPSLIRRTRPIPSDARLLVGAGDSVEAHELIAQPHAADGAVHEIVPAGRLLGVGDPRPYLTVPAGRRVAAGDVIARRSSFFGLIKRSVQAPIDGVLAPEQGGYGNVALMAGGDGDGVVAHLPGTVVGILPDQGVVVETTGLLVSGALGFGPAVRGPLLPPAARLDGALDGRNARPRGAIAVLDVLDRTQLELLRASGAAGAVVGSVAPELVDELAADSPSLGIVVVEGIGAAPLCAAACALLAGQVGELACLSPGQGEVIVPVPARAARLAPELKLARGAVVRVVGESTQMGEVAAVATTPSRLPSGVWTRLAEVDLESGERVKAPLANLELVS